MGIGCSVVALIIKPRPVETLLQNSCTKEGNRTMTSQASHSPLQPPTMLRETGLPSRSDCLPTKNQKTFSNPIRG